MALQLLEKAVTGQAGKTDLAAGKLKVPGKPGVRFEIVDSATGKTPLNIVVKKVGDNALLLVDEVEVEIEGFYAQGASSEIALVPLEGAPEVITPTSTPLAQLADGSSLIHGLDALPATAAGPLAAPLLGGMAGPVAGGAAVAGAAAGGGGGAGGDSTSPADTTAPAAPVINAVSGDNRISATEKAAGVAVSGTAEANSTVTITWGGTTKTVAADAAGNWTAAFSVGEIPADGTADISATATDAANNTSSAGTLSVTVDTVAPAIVSMVAHSGAAGVGTIVLTYNGPLDAGNPPATTDFAVTTVDAGNPGGTANPVASLVVAGSVLTLTLTNAFIPGNVTVAYTDPTAGNDVGATQDAAGNDAIGFSSGVAADGYVRGAQIYIDTNNDGVADADELLVGVVTDSNGNFFLPAGTPSGTLIAVGGVNIDTGVPNTVALKAPAGSTTINPLTTLVQAVIEATPGTSASDASATVVAALGLTAGTDLTRFDPLASNDVVAQKAAAQVATLLTLAEDNSAGAGATVTENLASQIQNASDAGATLNLADAGTLGGALSGTGVDAATQSEIADAAVAIGDAASGPGGNIAAISAAQSQALDHIAPASPNALDLRGTSDSGTSTTDNLTNATTPTVRVSFNHTALDGTAAVEGDTVVLKDNGVQVGTASIGELNLAAGFVDITTSTLAPGARNFTATLADQAGNVSPLSAALVVTLDTSAPNAPLINAIAGNDVVNAAEQASAITGSAEADAIIALSLGGNTRSVTANASGAWSYSLTAADLAAMGQGGETLSATARDAAGNTSAATTRAITVDTAAPTATAAVTGADDNVTPTTGNIAGGGTSNDNTLGLSGTITGTLNGGEVVAIYDGAGRLGTATVTGATWAYTTPSLANATHGFTVRIEDAAGNQGGAGAAYTVTVNASVPAATASITGADDDIAGGIGNVASGGLTNDATPTLSGAITGSLGSDSVIVYDGGTRLGAATINGTDWTYTPATLSSGAHSFTAVVEASGGNQGAASSAYVLNLDTTAPGAPSINPVATDNTVNAAEKVAGVTVTGTAEAGASLAVTWGTATHTVTAGGGVWSTHFTSGEIPADGDTPITATATDAAGNTGTPGSRAVHIDSGLPGVTINVVAGDDFINVGEKNATPGVTLTGTADPDSSITLSLGGNTRTVTANGVGVWSTLLSAADYAGMGQGAEILSAIASDAAGNASLPATRSITIDTAAPLLTPFTLAADSDSGVQGDGKSNVAAPSLQFTAENGSTLEIDLGDGTSFRAAGTGTGGAQTLTAPAYTADGTYTMQLRATDAAGNTTTRHGGYTLDTAAPGTPTINTVATDNLVNAAEKTAGVSVSGTADAGSSVAVTWGTTTKTVTATGGNWNATFASGEIPVDGNTDISAVARDAAGNAGSTGSKTVTVDTSIATPTMTLTHDSGASNSDRLTNDAALTFGATAADVTRTFTVDGGTASASYTAPTADGSHTVVVTDTDTAGNVASASLAFTLDKSIATPTVALAADTGIDSDGLTNDAALTFSATAADVTRTFTVDGGSASASYTAPTTDGSYTVAVTDTDTAGNVASASLTFTLDKSIATPTLALTNDTGASNSDTITNDAALTFSATAADVTRTFTVDGGSAAASYTAPTTDGSHTVVVTDTDTAGNVASASLAFTLDATAPAAPTPSLVADTGISSSDWITSNGQININGLEAGATWQYTLDGGTTWSAGSGTSSTLPAGTHAVGTLGIRQIDQAGNVSAPDMNDIQVIVDATTPAAPTPSLAADTGISNSDWVTSNGQININGLEAGATWQYTLDGGTTWSAGSGTSSTLPAGTHAVGTLGIRQIDQAGNVSAPDMNDIQVIVDATAPTAPTLALAADTGDSAGDRLTNDATLTFSAPAADVTRTFTVDSGTASASYTAPTTDGSYTVAVTDTDTAGNVATASLTFTLDATAPTATLAITGADDNVAPNTSNIAVDSTSNDNTPTLNGTLTGSLGAGEVIAVYDGAAYLGNAGLTALGWSFTTAGLGNGAHSFTARVEDAAGNLGAMSSAYAFSINATVPTATATITGLADDVALFTGNVAGGGVTNDTAPALSGAIVGTLAAGDLVRVYDGATLLGNATVSGAGWSFDIASLVEGVHSFTAVVENTGGTQGAASSAYTVTVDATAPAAPSVAPADATIIHSGGSLYINNGQIDVTGLEANATWQYTLDSGANWLTGSGNSFTLAEGTYRSEVQVRQIDAAGNAGTPDINDGEPVVVDAHAAAPTLALAADTGSSASDGVTRNGQVNVTGLEVGAAWQYSIDAGSNWSNGTGNSLTLTGDGAKSVIARQTDLAGNASANSSALDFTLDSTAPTTSVSEVNGATLTIHYNEALDSAHPPAASDFAIGVNGSARAVSDVAVSGSDVILTLVSPVLHEDTVTLAYTDPAAGDDAAAIQDIAGNDADSSPSGGPGVAGWVVGNATPDVTAPVLQTATVNGNLITLTYNEPLDPAHQPSASYFLSTVNGLNRVVDNLAISGNSVSLTLRVPVSQGDSVTLSYLDPSGGNDVYAIQDTTGHDALALSDRTLANETVGNASSTHVVRATFTETSNATVTYTFNEVMQASYAPSSLELYKNGVGGNILNTGVSPTFNNDGTVTFATTATLGATDYVVATYRGSGLRDMSDHYTGSNTLVIGGSGVSSDIDLGNIDWSRYTTPITIRGNGGDDPITGSGSNDVLYGNAGSDTLNGGWGADTLMLTDGATRAADTVVTSSGGSSDSQPFFHDTVVSFDVSGTTANDQLNLPSNTIAASTAGFVDGTDAGVIKSHSIGDGGIVTFGSADGGTPVLINSGNLNAATRYLESNITTPGDTVAFAYDADGNGQSDSLFVFQDGGGTDIDNDTMILLAGVNGATLGTTTGQNVVRLVDSTGPNIGGASMGSGANVSFTIEYNETIQVAAGHQADGFTVLKNGAGTSIVTGGSASGRVLTLQTNADLAAGDYLLVSYDAASGAVKDLSNNAAGSIQPAFALGGTGNSTIDLSLLSGGIGVYDLGGHDTITGNASDNDIEGGDGTDAIHAGGGDDYLSGGSGADTLDGGTGTDEFSFTQGESTEVSFSNGAYTFTSGADVINGGFEQVAVNGNSQTADRIHLRSAMPGNGLSLMDTPANGQATDQKYFLERGTFVNDAFAVNTSGADTLVVYDGNSETGAVAQTALVLQGVLPSQLSTWGGDIYLSSGGNTHAPAITSNGSGATATINVAENTTAVTTVAASDADGGTLAYSLNGGADAAKFSIHSSTGALTFNSTPDFETPTDDGANNIYDVTVQVSDGLNTDTQAIAVTVTDVVEGGGDTAAPINTGANFSESVPVVGTWTLGASADNAFVTLALLADGRFMYMEGSGDTPNGLEAGTYSYNAAGTLAFNITSDFNDGGGIGPDLNGVALPVSVVNGRLNITFAPGEVGEFDRQPVSASGVAGTWLMPTSPDEPFSLMVLYADGRYMYGEGSGVEPNGMESGTYTYNGTTGALAFTTLFDNNSDGGVSINGAPSSVSAAMLNSGSMRITTPDSEILDLARQYPATVTTTFNETVMAGGPEGISFSLNPSEANNWNGTPLAVTNTAITDGTVAFSTWGVLNSTDVVRMRYDAGPGNLADLAGNEVASGETFIGGSGNNSIDLHNYWPQNGFPVALRGNGGADTLIGTQRNDLLVDGGGADTLAGGFGADLYRLVENGGIDGGAAYSRDVVKIGLGESPSTGAPQTNSAGTDIDVVLGSYTSSDGTGFDIASGIAANHDVLDLPSNTIAAATVGFVAGATDSTTGTLAKHSISGGIIRFKTAADADVAIDQNNAEAAINYLELNIINRSTVAFEMDSDGTAGADSLIVFQDSGTIPLVGNYAIPDVAVALVGITGATLGITAGANVVQIVDTQAPDFLAWSASGSTLTYNFTENVFADTGVALTLLINGSTPAVIGQVDGSGTSTLTLTTNQAITAADWGLVQYTGTTAANGFQDAAGNVMLNNGVQRGGTAQGMDGDNSIDLSGRAVANSVTDGFRLGGGRGNDTLIGSGGDDRLSGGRDVDTLTGDGGSDRFVFAQGDSPTVGFHENGGAGVSTGDTFTFAGLADRITDFSAGETIELNQLSSTLINSRETSPSYLGGAPGDGLVTNQGYFAVQGNHVGDTFTVDTTATGADTLIVYDGDSSAAVTQTAIVLSSVTLNELNLYTGNNWVSHV